MMLAKDGSRVALLTTVDCDAPSASSGQARLPAMARNDSFGAFTALMGRFALQTRDFHVKDRLIGGATERQCECSS